MNSLPSSRRVRLRSSVALHALLVGTTLKLPAASGTELLENGAFDQATRGWEVPGFWAGGSGQTTVSDGRICTTITEEGTDDWGAQLRQTSMRFFGGAPYSLQFTAWASTELTLPVSIVDEPNDFADLFSAEVPVSAPLSGPGERVTLNFESAADSTTANFRFLMGGGIVPAGHTLCLDEIELSGPVNLVGNSTFGDGTALGWETGFWGGTGSSDLVDERLCAVVETGGEEPWMVQLRVNDLPVRTDRAYTVSADLWASAPGTLHWIAIDEGDDYKEYFRAAIPVDAPLAGPPLRTLGSFVADADTDALKLSFHLGGGLIPDGTTVCVDNVRLLDPIAEPPQAEPPPPPIHVNQLGYLPGFSKVATYALPSGAPRAAEARRWELLLNDVAVASGWTSPFGSDAASGDHVHHVDFSAVDSPGDGLVLRVHELVEDTAGGTTTVNADDLTEDSPPVGLAPSFDSQPFSIGADLYANLPYDALAYFYHNRSGTPIESSVVGEPWARPAGHLSDSAVTLLECETEPCETISAAGGWYDAGDHGKYVVNGGISAWTLLHQYERATTLGGNAQAFADGTMQLPEAERSNGIPDLLDEARWEVEWLLKMQIQPGLPGAGLAYHKLHDTNWTALPTAPHEDAEPRRVHPPSTAATLNVAAVAAQSARIWRDLDPEFSAHCERAARAGYAAAIEQPSLFAPGNADGGGGYTDGDVTDEFYWAATELYLTTGEELYREQLEQSPWHLQAPLPTAEGGFSAAMTWQQTSSLGLISLATVGPRIGADFEWTSEARSALVSTARAYVDWMGSAGYGAALSETGYDWGSNSRILNNLLVIGLAGDFTCDPSFSEALHSGMGYLLGRNPLGLSYVTGYGSRAVRYPHHRFWAEVLDPDFPPAPAGAVSGGPNAGLQDPIAQWLEGCAPQRCFLDDIHAWSLNEITINWNAPLAAVSAYLLELSNPQYRRQSERRCRWRQQYAEGQSGSEASSCLPGQYRGERMFSPRRGTDWPRHPGRSSRARRSRPEPRHLGGKGSRRRSLR